MSWLRKFMAGRYGADRLSVFLLILSVIFRLIGDASMSVFIMVGYILLFLSMYRILSKDIQKRKMENYKFAILVSPIYSRLKKMQARLKGLKTHKYYKCSKCKTILRVAKGKGKILVTCPKCSTKFIKKT